MLPISFNKIVRSELAIKGQSVVTRLARGYITTIASCFPAVAPVWTLMWYDDRRL